MNEQKVLIGFTLDWSEKLNGFPDQKLIVSSASTTNCNKIQINQYIVAF